MKKISIYNFRCFERQDVDFKTGINLIIGDNGAGKTSLLKACKYVLSSFFAGFSDENTNWLSFADDDFHEVVNEGMELPTLPIKIEFDASEIFPSTSIFYLMKKGKKGHRMLLEGMRGYKDFCTELYENFYNSTSHRQQAALPLFACFSTEDIHSVRKISGAKFKSYTQKNSFGYYECLSGEGFLPYWMKRLLVLQEGHRNIEEIDIVRAAIAQVLGEEGCNIIRETVIRHNQGAVYFILNDGREVKAENLPDGFRRIVNIVVDLAFRCALLNRGIFGNDCCRQTYGTVLIDEIDMHLHPSLQSIILQCLQKGFPQLQFVVTTHAPMVMSSIKNNDRNAVYKMSYSEQNGYSIAEVSTYGLDLSSISQMVLNIIPRVKDVDDRLTDLFDSIDNEQYQEARDKMLRMRSEFGDTLPELAKAETMLNLME